MKYATLKQRKCIYLGWTPLKDTTYTSHTHYTEHNVDIPVVFIFFDIENVNTLRISHIVKNPCNNMLVDSKLLKTHIEELSFNIGIQLDMSHLKDYDGGRWYLDFKLV